MNAIPQADARQWRFLLRRVHTHLILICVMIVLTGCTLTPADNTPSAPTVPPTSAGTILPFTTIAQGEHLSANLFVQQPSIIVIASAQEVDSALRLAAGDPPKLAMNPHPIEQARQIDYNRFFAILVLQGKQATAGYGVTVQQIVRRSDQMIVHALFVEPKPGEGAAEVGTDPYHLVAVPKGGTWGQDVRFELVDQGKVVAETTHFIP